MTVAGLVLAAGEGRRLGRAQGAGRARRRAAGRPRGAGAGRGRAAPAGTSCRGPPTSPAWPGPRSSTTRTGPTGMGSSLRVGLAAMPADVAAVLVVPVDQPGLTPAAVRRVVGAAGDDLRSALVVATYAGRTGHPVLLGRDHWDDVAAAAVGDVGARPVLAALRRARRPGRVRRHRRRLRHRRPRRPGGRANLPVIMHFGDLVHAGQQSAPTGLGERGSAGRDTPTVGACRWQPGPRWGTSGRATRTRCWWPVRTGWWPSSTAWAGTRPATWPARPRRPACASPA